MQSGRLFRHCPYIILFYADNGNIRGEKYNELALIRLDGESRDKQGSCDIPGIYVAITGDQTAITDIRISDGQVP